ncbi:hypothetical protein SAMN05444398_101928 [Roseovarius pacificus]|uniref:Uncharacterized protein n=1 Tax=Roseovarius pacificus TaxID=337701 RepID=A0A1M6YMD4_9RHOB|nr:hypothetical protein SAMN05444398_101928 [Roseovarius pacificus]
MVTVGIFRCLTTDDLVRTAGLEPARSYDREIFLPATAFAADATAPFVVWTIPSP